MMVGLAKTGFAWMGSLSSRKPAEGWPMIVNLRPANRILARNRLLGDYSR